MDTSFLADMHTDSGRQSLSLRIKNRCQLPIAEVYSDKDTYIGRSVANLKIIDI